MGILEDKVIVIGGVGPAMGRATAVRAARHGAKVVMSARTASRLDDIVAEIEAEGGVAVAVPSDIGVVDDCRRVAQVAVDRFGRIDGVAMIACMEPDRTLFDDTDDEFDMWRKITDFNLYGTISMVKQCLKHMPRGGSVAIVGSVSQDQGYPFVAPYAAAKAGLAAMVRSLAIEYGVKHKDRDIRFNMATAGGVAGEPYYIYVQQLADMAGVSFEEQKAAMSDNQPLGYIPIPEEYADSLIFLLSDMSRGLQGQNVQVNGGAFMKP